MPPYAAEPRVRAAFAEQAEWCRSLASPLTALLCDALATCDWPEGEVARRMGAWPGDPRPSADAVPLRLCGGLHDMVRDGTAAGLARCYPPHALPEAGTLWTALAEVLAKPALAAWLDRPPQTNEVGRSNALIAGAMAFVARHRVPVALYELGASAGLNLNMARFGYELAGARAGYVESPLQLAPEWTGPPPPDVAVEVVARHGVDRTPIDAARDGDRLLAYVWADQPQRIAQLEAALTVAAAHPVTVEAGDAGDWIERRLAEPPSTGTGRLVYHSIAFQYFSYPSQLRVRAAIERAGAGASEASPVGWLRFERTPDAQDPELRLVSWPGGEDRLLATCHPHGTYTNWLGDAPARVRAAER